MAETTRTPPIAAGVLMGTGLGGFIDGIMLHQILQWHNRLSSRIPPNDLVSAKVNMAWDEYFHLAVWVLTAIGLGMLWGLADAETFFGPARHFLVR